MLNTAIINLVLLQQNAKAIKSILPPFVKFIAVVKADAYGHGLVEVSSAIYPYVDAYAVALPEEGVTLRSSGIDKDILVLTPPVGGDYDLAVKYDLTLSVQTEDEISLLDSVANSYNKIVKAQIAVNTGMNRFGVLPTDIDTIIKKLKKSSRIAVDGVYSHLYQPQNPLTRIKQSREFCAVANKVKDSFPFAYAHLSASGGVLKGEFYDAVRVGLLLYGYLPFNTRSKRLKITPVMTVTSHVVGERKILKGDRLMYGSFKAQNDVNALILRYGYADGLMRTPIENQLNFRCMDVTAVKKDEKKQKNCKNGENFYILYKNADEIAKKYGTISYEILCSVSHRARKIYLR
jgi:alanine racemase